MDIAKLIDHTMLGGDADAAAVDKLCDEALEWGFKTVVVQPCRVPQAVGRLRGTGIGVGTVAGFPFGADVTQSKMEQAHLAIDSGAGDIDMVINVGWIKDGRWDAVVEDISRVALVCRQAAGERSVALKVIVEACLLTDEEKRRAAVAVKEAGADFVKTSTGYLGPGANVPDVMLLRETVGPDFGVKASGGIRTLAQLQDLVAAGADRIGTSAGVAIMKELRA